MCDILRVRVFLVGVGVICGGMGAAKEDLGGLPTMEGYYGSRRGDGRNGS